MAQPSSMPPPTDPRIIIIGDGAVGTGVASLLAGLGLAPRFIGRSGPVAVDAVVQGYGTDDATWQGHVPAATAADVATASLAVVTVKAFDVAQALRECRALPAGAAVWPLGNGAIYEALSLEIERRPDLVWRLGYCTFGISVTAPRHYAWRSRTGEFAVGPSHQSAPSKSALTPVEAMIFARAPRQFKWHSQIAWLHRRKWLFNTVINSMTATRQLAHNGDLLADLPSLVAVFHETWLLGGQLWGAWPLAREDVYHALLKLIEATAANENSMARDRRLGRPTETDFLAGLAHDERAYPLLTAMHRTLKNESAT
ncbi:MAG: hypothetical protein FJ146_11870 [Deltaproteobacteria bacterium]|nr:hypothetical protein [Deltaproteobacteria bacterium]